MTTQRTTYASSLAVTTAAAFANGKFNATRLAHMLLTAGLVATTLLAATHSMAATEPDWGSVANPPPAWQQRSAPPVTPPTEQQRGPGDVIQKHHMDGQWVPNPVIRPLPPAHHSPMAVPQPLPQHYLDDWEARERNFWEREAYRDRVNQNNRRVVAILGDKQDAQLQRITDGVAQGRVARQEFVHLMTEQQKVRQFERQAISDGMWTRPEYESALQQYAQIDRFIDKSLRRNPPNWGFNGQPQYR